MLVGDPPSRAYVLQTPGCMRFPAELFPPGAHRTCVLRAHFHQAPATAAVPRLFLLYYLSIAPHALLARYLYIGVRVRVRVRVGVRVRVRVRSLAHLCVCTFRQHP